MRVSCLALMLAFLLAQVVSKGLPEQGGRRRVLVTPVAPIDSQLVESINSFGNELFNAVGKGGEGTFLSPFSVAQAMGMLLNGAEPGGESASQIDSVVFGGDGQTAQGLNVEMLKIATKLTQLPSNSGMTISNANSAWVEQSYTLQKEFQDALTKYCQAEVEPLTSAEEVNAWVSDATNGKITDIVDEPTVKEAIMLLINALYFNATWESVFETTNTQSMPFYQLTGNKMDASMMFQSFDALKVYNYEAEAVSDTVPCVAVRLPYSAGDVSPPLYSAVFAMPVGNLSSVAGANTTVSLDVGGAAVPYTDALAACRAAIPTLGKPTSIPVLLNLPRFEIEFEASLGDGLQELGVTKPFEGGDLTKIANKHGVPTDQILVSDVLQKVYIKVAEKGTEAAAATVVIMVGSAFVPNPVEPVEITFDRPFAMAIMHDETGVELFIGEVYSPEAWEEPK